METSDSDPKPKKNRAPKPLPPHLLSLSHNDTQFFDVSLEAESNPKSTTHNKEFYALQSVTVPGHEQVDAHKLNLDQLRSLCRLVGIKNAHQLNKFECRKSIANQIRVHQRLREEGITPQSQHGRLTSTICRAVNVCFSEPYLADLEKVNDLKNRVDHESGNTHKDFWIRATDAHNTIGNQQSDGLAELGFLDSDDEVDDEFIKFIVPPGDKHLAVLLSDRQYDLSAVDTYETDAFRKKIMTLFKVRRVMKDNMTRSGTHDNDAWNFVEAAMREHSGLTKLAVYYFYMRCEEPPELTPTFNHSWTCPLRAAP